MQTETIRPLSVGGLFDEPLRSMIVRLEPLLEKLFGFEQCRQVFAAARQSGVGMEAIRRMLELLAVDYRIAEGELDRIPAFGPMIVTANHPFGLLDGAILALALTQMRPDVRILTNSMLAGVSELLRKAVEAGPANYRARVALAQFLLSHGNVPASRKCGEDRRHASGCLWCWQPGMRSARRRRSWKQCLRPRRNRFRTI